MPADSVFLKLYVGNKLLVTKHQSIGPDRKYALSATLNAGLITYRTEFGVKRGGAETILEKANDLVCGDVFVIQGQSNAEAWTDERVIHPYKAHGFEVLARRVRIKTVPGTRSGAMPCLSTVAPIIIIPNWLLGSRVRQDAYRKAQGSHLYHQWGAGGTRIDQHQRNEADPTDVKTIYGRLLWRLQQAKLTHGVRAVLWHQGGK